MFSSLRKKMPPGFRSRLVSARKPSRSRTCEITQLVMTPSKLPEESCIAIPSPYFDSKFVMGGSIRSARYRPTSTMSRSISVASTRRAP